MLISPLRPGRRGRRRCRYGCKWAWAERIQARLVRGDFAAPRQRLDMTDTQRIGEWIEKKERLTSWTVVPPHLGLSVFAHESGRTEEFAQLCGMQSRNIGRLAGRRRGRHGDARRRRLRGWQLDRSRCARCQEKTNKSNSERTHQRTLIAQQARKSANWRASAWLWRVRRCVRARPGMRACARAHRHLRAPTA